MPDGFQAYKEEELDEASRQAKSRKICDSVTSNEGGVGDSTPRSQDADESERTTATIDTTGHGETEVGQVDGDNPGDAVDTDCAEDDAKEEFCLYNEEERQEYLERIQNDPVQMETYMIMKGLLESFKEGALPPDLRPPTPEAARRILKRSVSSLHSLSRGMMDWTFRVSAFISCSAGRGEGGRFLQRRNDPRDRGPGFR
ncbi:expressed unknown protein [Seminavis robusta]|uniref:Uncharacterized protein n=1 Tax=Seminavis robusta TaxID=568900 RepID=A0A9N8EIQ8_9STRA|nr:expressed unknown protein [Seminavis robusta]|eukprot:Sro1062_g236980.1 n/a (200) ;mRNA; f:24217-24816